MECLEGGTLAQRLEKGALPLDKAMRYAVQIADALETTHRQGIVHRDLKPGNVMLTDAGAKLLDFGIARHTAHDVRPGDATILQSVATATGVRLGSPGYMAPEQILGGSVDERSDLFAFGIVLTEMLTGVHPFAEEARRYDGGHCPGPAGETKWPDEVAHSASREAPCQRAGFSSVVVP